MEHPELKQFGDLTAADFERDPVWIACHGIDQDQPGTIRPTKKVPDDS